MKNIQNYNYSDKFFFNEDQINNNYSFKNKDYISNNNYNNQKDFINNNNNNIINSDRNEQYINNIFNANVNENNNYLNNNDKNEGNIFGLNFHQDEDADNEIVNSLHFSKFDLNNKKEGNFINDNSNQTNNIFKLSNINNNNYNNTNNYEQKIKKNRNIISNCMKNSLIIEDEPFQISVSKYSESNMENNSIFNNSKANKNNSNINNNNQNNYININNELDFDIKEYNIKNNYSINNYNENKKEENTYNNKNNINQQKTKKIKNKINKSNRKLEEQNISNNNLLSNNNNINHNKNANINKSNSKKISYMTHYKSFNSKTNPLNNKKHNEKIHTDKNSQYKDFNNKPNQNTYNIENNNLKFNNASNNISIHNNNNFNLNKLNNNNYNSNRIYNMNKNYFSKFNTNEYNSIKEENFKKLYTKNQKAELDMVRGCFIYDKKYFNFDIKNGLDTVNYIKFIKPTEPIIQINYRNIGKFYPLIRKKFLNETSNNNYHHSIINNKINNNHKMNLKKYLTIQDKNSSSIFNEFTSQYESINKKNITDNNYNNNISSNKKIKKNNKALMLKKNNFHEYNNNNIINNIINKCDMNNNYIEKENNNYNKLDKDGISIRLKQKIYDWLVDIDIIKDKIIKKESIPTLCINGVLLCDLINRCEGKNEILKGIIRRTATRSQIQVNINKVLEYLRSLEKFPSRHLWDNIEISKGNSLIIWELLDDIYHYYGNKIKYNIGIRKNNSKNSLNRTFTKPKINTKLNKKDNNYYSNTPLISRKMLTLNDIKNKNNDNNEDSLYINNNNNNINNKTKYSKHSHTPIISKKMKNKIKPINNNNIYDININKKIFNNYDNYKKINKKEKQYKYNSINNDYDYASNFNYKKTESSNRNNLNHTNDNFYESKMFSIDNSNDNVNIKDYKNKKTEHSNENTKRRMFDVSSIYTDRFFNVEKSNKSFSVNNGFYKKGKIQNNLNNINISRYNIRSNNQSFYSTNPENRMRNKGCFLLFEKSSANKLKEKIGAFNKYNTNEVETLDIKDF